MKKYIYCQPLDFKTTLDTRYTTHFEMHTSKCQVIILLTILILQLFIGGNLKLNNDKFVR